MATINPFSNQAFNIVSMTEMVNNIDFLPQQLAQDSLFIEEGVPTWDVIMDILHDDLNRLGTKQFGAEPNVVVAVKAALKKLSTYHIPVIDSITPFDIQGVREPGGENLTAYLQVIARKQARIIRGLDLTHEWFRMGAIQGFIAEPGTNTEVLGDATVLLDLTSEFTNADGSDKDVQTLDFETDTSTTDIRGKCIDALRLMETALGGRQYTGAVGYLEARAFDALTGHDSVKDAFKYTQSVQPSADLRKGFTFGGILWKEYRQRQISGVNEFIDEFGGFIVPLGARNFWSFYGPAAYFAEVNNAGQKFVSKVVPALDDASAALQVQSNPLIINTNPDTTISVTMNDGEGS